MSLADVLAGGDAPQLAERLLGLIALGAGSNEIQIRRRDGSVRSCLVHASTVGADRVLGLLLDITDRKEAEEKLRDSEERFRGLSEAAFEAILVHDGGRIVDVNHALCELSGYSWHELVGRDGFELIATEYREAVYRNLLSEYTGVYEIECVRRDGGRIPCEIQARSFPYRGKVLRVVAVRDISERKKARRVRESLIRELEAKNAELERFGYAVTHDLKAPLVTIRGFADYLEKDAREGRGDRLAQDAARISEAVGRLQRLLDRLFELSRAGRAVGPPAAVPVAELVQESLRLLRERLAASGSRGRGGAVAAGRLRRPRAAGAGVPEPARQRDEVRGGTPRAGAGARAPGGARGAGGAGRGASASTRATATACSTCSSGSTRAARARAWGSPW